MIGIQVSTSGMTGLAPLLQTRIKAAFKSATSSALASARQSAPRRTGRLASSITLSRSGELDAEISYRATYASYLHEGTGIYGPRGRMIVILPRRKRALWWPGAKHPVGRVVQSGIRPRDFVSGVISGIAADLERALR